MVNRPGQIFVGRRQELAKLEAALAAALCGKGQVVTLAGEPGIGKTRLAQELASRAEYLGAQVLWGWCYEHAGAPPYWPYVQPIRAYIETADPQQLRSQMGPGGTAIAEIVPELREKLPDLGQPLSAEPEQARFRLFDSVATFLKNASQTQPLVFVVDDLHWADGSSLLLLEFLAREIAASPLLILGIYRDVEVRGRHPLSQTLGNLLREQHFQRVQLRGLSLPEMGEFVEANAGVRLPGDVLASIYSRTEGNPLFVNEWVRLIDPEQITENKAWANIIPDGVRDAIWRRLSLLSNSCNEVLQNASVIGREFDFYLLSGLDSHDDAKGALKALEEALEAKVIDALPLVVGRYQFGHALIQQSLYETMPLTRRVQAHARIGEALERLHQAELDEHAAELAYHFDEAQSMLGTEKLIRYSLLAGERALATHAYDEARSLYQKGLVANGVPLTGNEPVENADGASLLFGLGRTLAAIADYHANQEGLDSLSRAFDFYERAGDLPRALAVAEFPQYAMHEYETAAELVTRALALVPEDSHDAGRLLASHGQFIGLIRGDYAAAQDAFGRALVIARAEGDTTLEIRTMAIAISVDNYHFHWSETIERAQTVIQMARQIDDLDAEVEAHYFATTALTALGDLELAHNHASAMLPPAQRLQNHFWLAGAFWKNMIVARLKGDWQAARAFGKHGLEINAEDFRLLSDWIMLEYELGEFQAGEGYLEQLVTVMHRNAPGFNMTSAYPAMFIGFATHITGVANRAAMAKEAAEVTLSSPFSSPNVATRARIGLALLAVHSGDAVSAGEQYPFLASSKRTMLLWTISADRLLGLLANTMDEPDQAVAHFEDALMFCRQGGFRPELAWSCHDYADTLLQREGSVDRQTALSLLDDAQAISSELGMLPLMARVAALQKQEAAQPGRAPVHPDGLTQREVEVLRLVATGKSNPEIGVELFISVNTVAAHVRNILSKTNTPNRIAAAGYAIQHGLTS